MSDETAEYERMKRQIALGHLAGVSPLQSVARMNPRLENAGVLLRRWLDERREAEQ